MSLGNLIIFVKNPIEGKVKTRLARTLGTSKALEIYLYLLHQTGLLTNMDSYHSHLFFSDYIDHNLTLFPRVTQKHVQTEGSLGEKMAHAFKTVFSSSKQPKKVIIIGSDCPELTTEIIQKAFEALELYDFVIGPSKDGGYYLLGMRQYREEVFKNIAWSTQDVLAETIHTIEALSASYDLLEPLNDIDEEKDWAEYVSQYAQFIPSHLITKINSF